MKMLNVALVGCGRIAFKHLDAIVSFSDRISLCALVDTNREAASTCLSYFDKLCQSKNTSRPIIYQTLDTLFDANSSGVITIDLVIIATPSGLHPQQAIACAKNGLNVLTEKPMATRWSDGLDMIKIFDSCKKKLFVVKQNRFNPTVDLAKNLIVDGNLGRIHMVTCNVFWTRPQSYYNSSSWRGTWEFDGGALMNQASHYVDLLSWLIGPIDYLQCITATQERHIEVEDSAVLNVKWRNGALGTMAVTMLTYNSNIEGSFTILGSHGSIRIAGKALNQIELFDVKDSPLTLKDIEDVSYPLDSVYGNGHKLLYKSILDDIQHDITSHCSGRSGLKSLELLIAAYRSAQNRTSINLPLNY